MKTLVIYDSQFGNTERVAKAIGATLNSQGDVKILRVQNMRLELLTGIHSLVVGSPTQRFRPTTAITDFLKNLPNDALNGIKVAAFDTRLTEQEINKVGILAIFVRIFGYAANPISNRLQKKGGELILPPEGFYVDGMEGPLLDGELERAADWGKHILSIQSSAPSNN
jgi:flavodoxin I